MALKNKKSKKEKKVSNGTIIDGKIMPAFLDVDQSSFLRPSLGLTPDGYWYFVVTGRDKDGEMCHVLIRSDANWTNIIERKAEEMDYTMTIEPEITQPRWHNKSINAFLSKSAYTPTPLSLFRTVKNEFVKYCDYEEEEYPTLLALFTILTYLHPLVDSLPIMFITGDAGSGKTRNARILANMAFNSNMGQFSSAVLRRQISATSPTMVVDDAEYLNPKDTSEKSKDIQNILRRNYKKGSTDQLVNKNTHKIESFDIFCPAVISCVTYLENALESRTIEIRMLYSTKSKVNLRVPVDTSRTDYWQNIRDKCYLFAMKHYTEFMESYETLEAPDFIIGREFELWSPLLALAKIIDGKVYHDVLKIAKLLIDEKSERKIPDLNREVIKSLIEIFKERRKSISEMGDATQISYTAIVSRTRENMEREGMPIPDYLNSKKLGYIFRSLGFRKNREINRTGSGGTYHLLLTPPIINKLIERYNMDEEKLDVPEPITGDPDKPEKIMDGISSVSLDVKRDG